MAAREGVLLFVLAFVCAATALESESVWVGRGKFDGPIAIIKVPVADVVKLIPDDIELSPQAKEGDKAKVVLFWIASRDVGPKAPSWVPGAKPFTYNEMAILVPYVRVKAYSSKGPFIWPVWVMVDLKKSALFGKTYGYDMKQVDIDTDNTSKFNGKKFGLPLWTTTWTTGAVTPVPAELKSILSMPWIGSVGPDFASVYTCARMNYFFDRPSTVAKTADITFDNKLLPLPKGKQTLKGHHLLIDWDLEPMGNPCRTYGLLSEVAEDIAEKAKKLWKVTEDVGEEIVHKTVDLAKKAKDIAEETVQAGKHEAQKVGKGVVQGARWVVSHIFD